MVEFFNDQCSINPSEFERATFVTMLFRLNTGFVKGDARDFESFYMSSLNKLIELFPKMVLFCDGEVADMLDNDQITIIRLSLEDLSQWKKRQEYRSRLQWMEKRVNRRKLLPVPEWMRSGCIVKKGHAEETAAYYALVNEKPYLMEKAMELNPYNTEYFYWIDAGILSHERTMRNFDGRYTYKPQGIRVTVSINPHEKKLLGIIKIFLRTTDFIYGFSSIQVSAGIWGGTRTMLRKFIDEYKSTLDRILEKRYITTEQGIMTIMLKRTPEVFDIAAGLNGYDDCIQEVLNQQEREIIW